MGSRRDGERNLVEGRGTERVGRGGNRVVEPRLCACGVGGGQRVGEWMSVKQAEVDPGTHGKGTCGGIALNHKSREVCGVSACFIACAARRPAASAGQVVEHHGVRAHDLESRTRGLAGPPVLHAQGTRWPCCFFGASIAL